MRCALVGEIREALSLLGKDRVTQWTGYHRGCCLEAVCALFHARLGMGEKVVVPVGIGGHASLGGGDEQGTVVGDLADQQIGSRLPGFRTRCRE
jgi:hypothetical protein